MVVGLLDVTRREAGVRHEGGVLSGERHVTFDEPGRSHLIVRGLSVDRRPSSLVQIVHHRRRLHGVALGRREGRVAHHPDQARILVQRDRGVGFHQHALRTHPGTSLFRRRQHENPLLRLEVRSVAFVFGQIEAGKGDERCGDRIHSRSGTRSVSLSRLVHPQGVEDVQYAIRARRAGEAPESLEDANPRGVGFRLLIRRPLLRGRGARWHQDEKPRHDERRYEKRRPAHWLSSAPGGGSMLASYSA